jgi:HEAT repeat protein
MNTASALLKIGSDKAVESLIQVLNDSDSSLRENLIVVLGNTESDKVIETFIKALKALKGKHPDVCKSIVKALGQIGNKKTVEPLIQLLSDQDSTVRETTVQALGKIGSEKAVEPLIRLLADKDSAVSKSTVQALGEIGSEKAVEPLIRLLTFQNILLRETTVQALGKIGSEKAVEPLIRLLTDQHPGVCNATIISLGDIGSNRAIEPLIKSLLEYQKFTSHEFYLVTFRINVGEALVKIGSDRAIEILIQSLKDGDSSIRKRAAVALGKAGGEKAIEPLIQALNDQNYVVRINVAEALGKTVSERAIAPLIQALKDQNSAVVKMAIESLSKIDTNSKTNVVVFSLLEILESNHSSLCAKAAKVLGEKGGEMAVRGLIPLLQDNDFPVRQSAAKALGEIAYPILIDYLYKLIPTTYGFHEIPFVITAIQARCKYYNYNYNIAQTPLQETENHANPVEKILQEIHQTIKTMSETGKYNIKAEVVQIVENNTGEVIAKKYANDPALLQTINEITQVLANLQKTHPTATEAEAKDIIEAEFKEIQNNQPNRWTTFRQQLLNRERWLNGGKATISEIAKHYAENNVFLIAGVAFLDGFSTDEE